MWVCGERGVLGLGVGLGLGLGLGGCLVDELVEAQLGEIVDVNARALAERGDGAGGLRRSKPGLRGSQLRAVVAVAVQRVVASAREAAGR